MLTIEINQADIALIEKKLGDLKDKTPLVIKRASLRTARNAKSILAAQVKSVYSYKRSVRGSMRVVGAGMGAMIHASSSNHLATSFHHKGAPPARGPRRTGRTSQIAIVRGQYEPFTYSGNNSWKSGEFIFARKKPYSRPSKKCRFPLWAAHGPTDPKMIEDKKVYGVKEPEIKQKLYQHIDSRIRELI